VVLSRRRLPPRRQESTGSSSPSLGCKCRFQVFQMFKWYVANISYGCCQSRSGMLQVFQRYVASVCWKCFICSQSYVVTSVFMLQVANVLSGCCICFTIYCKCMFRLFQTYVAFICFMLQVLMLFGESTGCGEWQTHEQGQGAWVGATNRGWLRALGTGAGNGQGWAARKPRCFFTQAAGVWC
jgi:hypothetical protein